MKYSYKGLMKTKVYIFFIIFGFMFSIYNCHASDETAELTFTGSSNSASIIKNLDYSDLRIDGLWSKDAIYTAGALEIMKGYGQNIFGRLDNLTKEQAIALAYRVAGLEAEAQIEAEKLPTNQLPENQGRSPQKYWSDGYLQMAVKNGLISQNDYLFAMNQIPPATLLKTPNISSFVRDDFATREEFAFYVGKLLKYDGIRGQNRIFNFKDWAQTAPEKIPYVEALLQRGIINGNDNGRLNPKDSITREQAAVMITNAIDYLPSNVIAKRHFGTVKSIEQQEDIKSSGVIIQNIIEIRNSNGRLHRLVIPIISETLKLKDRGPKEPVSQDKNVVVLKNGIVGDYRLISKNDRIEYISDSQNVIKSVRVISNDKENKYLVSKLIKIDTSANTIESLRIMDLKLPKSSLDIENYSFSQNGAPEKYVMKHNISVYIDNKKTDLSKLVQEKIYLFTLENDIVTEIANFKFTSFEKENTIISGVVEESNPVLKYLTLYDDDGIVPNTTSGIRKFEILNPSRITILKNYEPADFKSIEAGDKVYIKKDKHDTIISISAVSDYEKGSGKVLYIKDNSLSFEFEDGTQQIFEIEQDLPIYKDGTKATVEDIKGGDHLRVLMIKTPEGLVLKEISVDGDDYLITNIYKGKFIDYDTDKVTLSFENVERLTKEGFLPDFQKGIRVFGSEKNTQYYKNNIPINTERLNNFDKNTEAYFAVHRDNKADEKIVFLSLKASEDSERFLPKNSISFADISENFIYQDGNKLILRNDTICIKNNRLVKTRNIVAGDLGLVILNKKIKEEESITAIVKIDDRIINYLDVYRVNIKEIDRSKGLTVNSYLKWSNDEDKWIQSPNSKLFKLSYQTRMLDSEGVVNNKSIIDLTNNPFSNKSFYIVSDGVTAFEINEMIPVTETIRGKIYDFTPSKNILSGEENKAPETIKLTKIKYYDKSTLQWTTSPDTEYKTPLNVIIIKNGKRVSAKDLEINDSVRVLKKEDSAYIIFVEEQ